MPKPTVPEASRRCAAITYKGSACRNPAEPGRPLCRKHAAGLRPASEQNELNEPLYTEEIGEKERNLWDRISVTDLDAEIRVAKLQLKRLLAAQRRAELEDREDAKECSQRKAGNRMTARSREIDYDERVNRLLGRISDLVMTRARLQRDAEAKNKERPVDPADDPVERLARRIDRISARIGAKANSGEPDAGGDGKTGA